MSRKAAVIAAVVLAVLVVGGIFLSRSPLARINFAGSLGSGGRANVRVPPGFTIEVFADGLEGPRFIAFGPDFLPHSSQRGA